MLIYWQYTPLFLYTFVATAATSRHIFCQCRDDCPLLPPIDDQRISTVNDIARFSNKQDVIEYAFCECWLSMIAIILNQVGRDRLVQACWQILRALVGDDQAV